MKLLGVASGTATFRWDLLYLLSQLKSDERASVVALAPSVETAMNTLDSRQIAYEQARAGAIVAAALVNKRDKARDRLILEMGGVARATGRDVYEQLFPKYSPSRTTKLAMDSESAEVTRILAELGTLEALHPLRAKYEAALTDAQANLSVAKAQLQEAEVMLTLQRSHMQRCKVDLDKLRLETHGKLLALLADKTDADSFYRPTSKTPGEAPEEAPNA